MIGNRHAIAGAYLAAAALGVLIVSVLIAQAASEIERARRAELSDRKSAFGELEKLEKDRDGWIATAATLSRREYEWADVIAEATAELLP